MSPETTEVARTGFTADITHPDWPMAVGDRLVDEQVGDDGGVVRTETTVLAETVTVAPGIEVRVVHDLVMEEGAPVADTLDWYAQDAEGNVWHLGRQTAAYAADRVVSTLGSWEAGVDGARACIVLPRTPGDLHGDRSTSDIWSRLPSATRGSHRGR